MHTLTRPCANASTRRLALTLCALLGLTAPTLSHAQVQLLTNGNFETGTFAGFTLANQLNPSDTTNADHFYISAPGSDTPPVNTFSFATAPNPAGGNFYAVSTGDWPGAHALLQNFTVPTTVTGLQLTFQMFVNNQSGSGPSIDPSGLDYLTGGVTDPLSGAPLDNQHARVDILRFGAGDLSTSAADVIANLYLNVDPGTLDSNGNLIPNPYLTYSFDLLGVLTPGQKYRLRFAEVDNVSALNVGVDNISLLAITPAAVPEPGSLALLLASVTGGVFAVRRKRS